jgi:hypothetical protein
LGFCLCARKTLAIKKSGLRREPRLRWRVDRP